MMNTPSSSSSGAAASASRDDLATYSIQHNIRGTLNEVLNLTLRQMPEDPVRYIADLLESKGQNDRGTFSRFRAIDFRIQLRTDLIIKPVFKRQVYSKLL